MKLPSLVKKPFQWIWLPIPLFFLLGLYINENLVRFDLFGFPLMQTVWMLGIHISLTLGMLGLGYWSVLRQGDVLNPTLTRIHVLGTLLVALYLFFHFIFFSQPMGFIYSYGSADFTSYLVAGGIFLQAIFVLNLGIGVIRQ